MYSEMPVMTVPKLTPVNRILIIGAVAVFLIQTLLLLAGIKLELYLGVSGQLFLKGYLFQPLTYIWVSSGLIELLFNGLILWFIGSDLEQEWGTPTYAIFVAIAVFFTGLIYGIISSFLPPTLPLVGLSVISFLLLMSYSVLYPNRTLLFMMLFPMKAKYFCWLLAAIELYFALFSPYARSSWGHLLGMAFGLSYVRHFRFWYSFCQVGLKSLGRKRNGAHLRLIKDEGGKEGLNKRPKYWQ